MKFIGEDMDGLIQRKRVVAKDEVVESKYKFKMYVRKCASNQYCITLHSDTFPTPDECAYDVTVDCGNIHPFSFILDDTDLEPEFRGKPEDADYCKHDKVTLWTNICPASTGIIETLRLSPKKLQKTCPNTDWRWQRARLIKALDAIWT